ncbi:unnamed protein product [Miscanthus lutarioriparius]|uniref:Uncharacterized protein n=1 Tax=Miscanthus lutarioriparius TaxID=422564 RepID=A0A811Q392_9POAL|nr:unnamed protein product [Miscanthus lutarioriparius]
MAGLETRVKHLLDVAHRSGIAWNLFAHPHESGPVGDQEQSRGRGEGMQQPPLMAPTAATTTKQIQKLRPTGGAAAAGASCIPHERDALLAFKHGISSDPMNLLATCRMTETAAGGEAFGAATGLAMSSSFNFVIMNNLTGSSGQIPDFVGSLVNLRYLNLSSIPFTGRVPHHLGNLSKLKYFDLSLLRFRGQPYSTDISWLAGLSLLEYLDMSMVLRLNFCLLLSANQSLPHINLTNLERLDLSGNIFDHPMASSWLWNLTGLQYISLEFNYFYGQVPDALGDMTSLQVLDLSGNNLFEGELPRCFNATNLRFLLLGNNSFSGDFPVFLQNSKRLEFIDLSRNKFSGNLPHWIGGLVELRFLRLSENMFSGNIPMSITNLTHLHHLNLASNRLSGVIPWGMSNLTAMTQKYVKDPSIDEDAYAAYETLNRDIGQHFSAVTKGQQLCYDVRIFELQLDTLFAEYPSMYSGNSGLCGPTLRKICSGNNSSRQLVHEHGFEPMSFYFGLGLGFILGFWLVFCVLLFKKAWRVAYSCLIDKIYDQMYVLVVVTWKNLARE